jgi:hypothetical protein
MGFPEHVKTEWLEFAKRTRDARMIATRGLLTGRLPMNGGNRGHLAGDATPVESGTPAEHPSEPVRSAGEATDEEEVLIADNSEPLEFVNEAMRAALAVGRLVGPGGAGEGTCFMISRALLATADHCLPGRDDRPNLEDWRVEFNFDPVPGRDEVRARYKLAPERLCLRRQHLGEIDVAIIALGDPEEGEFTPEFRPLFTGSAEHAPGFHANIIHYRREFMEWVLRDNWILPGTDVDLGYRSQTDVGSSGAPVFNAAWEVIALHVSGESFPDPLPIGDEIFIEDEVNRGVRSVVIHQRLRQAADTREGEEKRLIDEAAPPIEFA